jgi:hypothetical protein
MSEGENGLNLNDARSIFQMLPMLESDKLINHIAKHGVENQKLKAIEELSELIKELSHDLLRRKFSKENLFKELIDCIFMIHQLVKIYDLEADIMKFFCLEFDHKYFSDDEAVDIQ